MFGCEGEVVKSKVVRSEVVRSFRFKVFGTLRSLESLRSLGPLTFRMAL